MKFDDKPLSRKVDIVIQELEKEVLIYDLKKNKAYCLNQTSAMVWQECDGTKTIGEITEVLNKRLKTHVSEDIIWLALKQFKNDDLLDNKKEFLSDFDKLSRREIVRRIGFASAVALPILSSIIAPSAVNAQSACFSADNSGSNSTPGCSCVGTFDCCGICSATNFCTGAPRGGAGGDPGAAPSCFPGLDCSLANNSGNNSVPGCPCIGTFDCCGICSATGFCTGSPRAAGGGDPGAAGSCP